MIKNHFNSHKEELEIEFLYNILNWPFRCEIERLCLKRGLKPDEIPFLEDLIYNYNKYIYHQNRFKTYYEELEKSLALYSKCAFESINEKDNRILQLIIPTPQKILYELEPIISQIKKTIEFIIKIMHYNIRPNSNVKYIHLSDIQKQLSKTPKNYKEIPGVINSYYPKFKNEFLKYWEIWIEIVKFERDLLEHRKSYSFSYMNIMAGYVKGSIEMGIQTVAITSEIDLINWLQEADIGLKRLMQTCIKSLLKTSVKGNIEKIQEIDSILFKIELREKTGQIGKIPSQIIKVKPLHEGFIKEGSPKLKEMLEKHKPKLYRFDRGSLRKT